MPVDILYARSECAMEKNRQSMVIEASIHDHPNCSNKLGGHPMIVSLSTPRPHELLDFSLLFSSTSADICREKRLIGFEENYQT
jgi:hypothetical protein